MNTKQDMGRAYVWLRGLTELIWWMMLAGGAILVVVVLLGVDGAWQHKYQVGIELDPAVHDIALKTEDGEALALTDLHGDLAVPGSSRMGFLLVLAWFGFVLLVVKTVRDIVRSLADGPFTPANASRIARIGWILMALAVLNTFRGTLQMAMFDTPVLSEGVDLVFRNEFELTEYFYPLVVLVLAQVFRYGARIEADQELTV